MTTVKILKTKLKEIGAKTSGNKSILTKRLKLWTEENLNHVLCENILIPATTNEDFPPNLHFKPLGSMAKQMILTEESIENWFLPRKAMKAVKLGRILSMKLFVKYGKYFKENNQLYIKAICAAQQKKETEYDVQILISNCIISQCNCTCPAGIGWSAACKHVAAVCFSIEHFSVTGRVQEYISCTEQPVQWNKPPAGRGVDFMSIHDIINVPATIVKSNDHATADLLNLLVGSKIRSPVLECRHVNSYGFINDHSLYTKEYCYNLLQEINKISVDERSDIEERTRAQSRSPLWFAMRRSRITGSMIKTCMSTVKSGNFCEGPALRQMEIKNLDHIAAVKWGRDHEDVAREEYCAVTGSTINKSGLWIDHIHTFLGSSPDGISFNLDLVVEIKCPYSIRFDVPTKAEYLLCKNGTFFLNRNHAYYAQCQLNMFVTNTSNCDFIVWTTKGIYIEHIKEDKHFQTEMISYATIYFKQVFAPMYFKVFK